VASHIAAAFVERGATVEVAQNIDVGRWLKQNPDGIVFGMDRHKAQTHLRAGNGVHAAYLKSRILAEGRAKYWMCLANPLHRKILRLEKQAFESQGLRKIFTNSHMVKREILDRFAIDPAKIEVIHNGVEWHEMGVDFENAWEEKPRLCWQLGLDPNHFHLLFIGNGYLRKGLISLLNGMACLKQKELHLCVVGNDRKQAQYERLVNNLGLTRQVRFFGHQPQVRPFYQFADALAIPSFYDPFANVTVEALAMGLFVLSSHYNGGSEVLTNKTGTCVDDLKSPSGMAEALQRTLSNAKSKTSALERRQSVQHLDYSGQMKRLVEACFG
jgi:UDP-glucose:(heptosyl)LPS alpha-1,3-glucosyltransferase